MGHGPVPQIVDRVMFPHPVWKVGLPAEVKGKPIAVVDEMADTEETLALVAERVRECGAAKVVTASLVSHRWGNPKPEIVGLVTDALILFPWDKHVYMAGQWRLHPELEEALHRQGQE